MTHAVPKWIQTRYAALWRKFEEKEFSYEQAEKVLGDKKGINVFFSDLRKAGWMIVGLDSKDSRKRIYRLSSPNNIYLEMQVKEK